MSARRNGVNMDRMRGEKPKTKAKPPGPVAPKVRDFGATSSSSKAGNSSLNKTGTSQNPLSIASSADEDEEDDEFEEVQIPSAGPSTPATTPGRAQSVGNTPGTNTTAPSVDDDYAGYDVEDDEEEKGDSGVIRVEFGGETPEEKAKRIMLELRKKPMTSKDRAMRLEAHKLHVLSLLASARIRNRWASDPLLKARLLSLLPHPLQAAFVIPPSRFKDRAHRSRLFFDALQTLVDWWCHSFFDISDKTLGMRTRPWDDVQELVDQVPRLTKSDFVGGTFSIKGKEKAIMDETKMEMFSHDAGAERLRSINSLMKKALQQEGSRDISAQLFVSLARACGLGTRLVVSLQAVPWRAEKQTPKKKPGAGRGGRTKASRQGNGPPSDEDDDSDEMEEVPIPAAEDAEGGPGEVIGKIKAKNKTRQAGRRRHLDPADVYRLRAPRPAAKTASAAKKKPSKLDLTEQPPVFWVEVFSRSDQRWIPVDPVKGIIRKKAHYEPQSDNGPIRMLYVIAFEEDGYARDVTLRYTKTYGAKTVKLRVPQKKDEPDWWAQVVGFLQRPLRLNRDELEDAELEMSQFSEGMPQHLNGFKDHPLYVLERHLKREEVIQIKREVGRFRGEPVYRRANVLSCKTAENWMRMGRRVKDKQEPLKWVKQRAVTIQKRRAQELAIQENGEAIQQGLYAEHQTDVYRPPPIQDGIIPTNSFGNIDLYAPTMLPEGAVHLPYKGIAKVAKHLGISYAEACTGFEFKNQRAIPTITGIVVAKDQEQLVLDAYDESTAAAEERERIKREDKALKRWVKLVNGIRVKARLQAEYGQGENLHDQQFNPLAAGEETAATLAAKPKRSAASVIANTTKESAEAWTKRARTSSLSPSDGEDEVPGVAINQAEDTAVQNGVKVEPQVAVALAEAREGSDEGDDDPSKAETLIAQDQAQAKMEEADEEANTEDEDLEEIQPLDKSQKSPTPPLQSQQKRTIKLTLNAGSGAKTGPSANGRSATRGSKRKARSPELNDDDDEEEESLSGDKEDDEVEEEEEQEAEHIPRTKSRGPKRSADRNTKTSASGGSATKSRSSTRSKPRPPKKEIARVPAAPITRSLRSRAPKSEDKAKKEEEARAKVRAALASDVEDEDESEDGDDDALAEES